MRPMLSFPTRRSSDLIAKVPALLNTADSPIWNAPVPVQVALALWLVRVRLPRRLLVLLPLMDSVAELATVVLPKPPVPPVPYSSPPVQLRNLVTVIAP